MTEMTKIMELIRACLECGDLPKDIRNELAIIVKLDWPQRCTAFGRMAKTIYRIGRPETAEVMALLGLSQDQPRGCYELGMEYFYDGNFILSVRFSEMCLHHVPEWPYAFLAMHSLAAAYHKAGLPQMADSWGRAAVEKAPFFEPSWTFIINKAF